MSPPITKHGLAVQDAINALLKSYGYEFSKEEVVEGFVKSKNRLDTVAWHADDPTRKVVISSKYQATPGTTEEKIPFEVMRLVHVARADNNIAKCYIVLDGNGWSARIKSFYLEDGLAAYIKDYYKIKIITREQLIDILRSDALTES